MSPLTTAAAATRSWSRPCRSKPAPAARSRTQRRGFYILDGEICLQISDETAVGTAGDLVRIPRGVPHGIAVKSRTARFLNLYVPGALDVVISMLGTPATGPGLPPDGSQQPPSAEQIAGLGKRLEELAAQRWTGQPDLLAEFRTGLDDGTVSGPTS